MKILNMDIYERKKLYIYIYIYIYIRIRKKNFYKEIKLYNSKIILFWKIHNEILNSNSLRKGKEKKKSF